MFRILKAPPGFLPEEQYRLVEYENSDLDSHISRWRPFASLEETRSMIPKDAVRLPFEPMNQFLELYSQDESNQQAPPSGHNIAQLEQTDRRSMTETTERDNGAIQSGNNGAIQSDLIAIIAMRLLISAGPFCRNGLCSLLQPATISTSVQGQHLAVERTSALVVRLAAKVLVGKDDLSKDTANGVAILLTRLSRH